MPLDVDSIFFNYRIVSVVDTNSFREIYNVIDVATNKKERTLVIILKEETDHDYDPDCFLLKDCIIQSVPKYNFKDSRFFPSVITSGTEEHPYFVCESLDKNIMSYFYDNGRRINRADLRDYSSRMFHLLSVFQEKRQNNDVFYNICPYDFYINPKKKKNMPRIFLVNQNLKKQNFPKFNKRFDSISVCKGNKPTLVDNAISLIYCLLYLYKGTLPWMSCTTKKELKLKAEFPNQPVSKEDPPEIEFLLNCLKQFDSKPEESAHDFKDIAQSLKQLAQSLESPKKKKKEMDLSSVELPAKKQTKRTHKETKVNEKSSDANTDVEGIKETNDADEMKTKKRKIWNSIRSVIIDPLLITSTIWLGKYIYTSFKH